MKVVNRHACTPALHSFAYLHDWLEARNEGVKI